MRPITEKNLLDDENLALAYNESDFIAEDFVETMNFIRTNDDAWLLFREMMECLKEQKKNVAEAETIIANKDSIITSLLELSVKEKLERGIPLNGMETDYVLEILNNNNK